MIPIPETNGFIEILKPQQIVEELDKHIIGQRSAKVALAIALRNRWRRMQLSEEMQAEIQPKNILMIGPTGVGKTELARKLAKLAKAPFIKVDATKFTEVGYVGRDVESIVRDLVEAAFRLVRAEKVREADALIIELAEERILDALIPGSQAIEQGKEQESSSRQVFRKKLREGALDEKEIEVLINRSREAQKQIENYTQDQVDELIKAMVWSVAKPGIAEKIAQFTVDETQLGNYDGKFLKIQRKTRATLMDIINDKSVGILEEDLERAIVKIAKPMGVIGALSPSTNPEATPAVSYTHLTLPTNREV